MQFTTLFALAATFIGVSADVHKKCNCVDSATGLMDVNVTAQACADYPKTKFFGNFEHVVSEPSSVIIDIDQYGYCETKNAASGKVAAHLGGNEFSDACASNAPENVVIRSVCFN